MSDFEKEYRFMRIGRLIGKASTKGLTAKEQKELADWLAQNPDHYRIQQNILNDLRTKNGQPFSDGLDEKSALSRIKDRIRYNNSRVGTRKRIIAVLSSAAAIVAVLGITWYYVGQRGSGPQTQIVSSAYGNDVIAGRYRAQLRRNDGQTIQLSEQQSGIVIGNEITYLDGSQVFDGAARGNEVEDDTDYYVLSTPKGGTYRLTLPDGTDVWLNSASTLKYPSRFNADERVVELSGEAYFDVNRVVAASNSLQVAARAIPFVVKTAYKSVKVLGTEFNVNAYPEDHAMRTTLVTGKITIDNQVLSPSQSALWDGNTLSVNEVADIQEYIAWKHGEFYFSATPLRDVLSQLERWYDIDVTDLSTATQKIYGSINRNHRLSTVLYTLEKASGLTFEIKERRLIVRDKLQ